MRRPSQAIWRFRVALAAAAASAVWSVPASAQLDPLLIIKRTQPNVIIAVDLANRMMKDGDNNYYDPNTYTKTGAIWEGNPGLNVQNSTGTYRRKYLNLVNVDQGAGSDKFTSLGIETVGNQGAAYNTFWEPTRLAIARRGLIQAVTDNQKVARFGLIKMRQGSPTWGTALNEGPIAIDPSNTSQQFPTELVVGKWNITRPTTTAKNGSITVVQAPLVVPGAANGNTTVLDILNRNVGTAGALIPAGQDSQNSIDAPIEFILDDAKAAAQSLISGDTECKNTVVVLVVGGEEGQTASGTNPVMKAQTFLNISNRRVPIYVIALMPRPSEVAQLQGIAESSGGQYFEITSAMVAAVPAGRPVPDFTRAVNIAIQHAFAEFADFNTAPSPALPFGPKSEFAVTSPIIGTVNLEDAEDINGSTLSDGRIENPDTHAVIPQRSNVMLTTAFSLPGFDGQLRAFRVYKPLIDPTKPVGYRFESDGRRLWVGTAPPAAQRNIYTVTPSGTMTAFTPANAAVLAPYMNTTVTEAARIIDYVRRLPVGPFVGSTPAIMDAPSIDPAPDPEYPGFADANKNRRTLVWLGGNRGLMHAFDGRLGLEVWAFVPFNLLPKLAALLAGHAVGNFDYFVDSSAKVADVRVSAPCVGSDPTCWRTYLFFGEGPGGTFYQAFDVTMSDMATVVSQTSDNASDVLGYFSDPGRITFKWAFPSYQNFDYTLLPYGDIKAAAPDVEKSVGETWSDPAVGRLDNENGQFTMLTGSGFFPASKQLAANRGGIVAGSTFYLLDVETGALLDSRDVGNDNKAENVDNCALQNPKNCEEVKNALQADPVATGPPDSRYITKAYVGDLDGRVWRFDVGMVGGVPRIKNVPTKLFDAGANQPIFASMATVNVGATQYIFFATGSDLLPTDNLGTLKQGFKMIGVLDPGGTKTLELALTRQANRLNEEKPTAYPAVAGDIVFFTTTMYHPATTCIAPDANLYAVTFIGGPAYDNNGDNKLSNTDTQKVKTIAGARATAPFIVDQHVVFGSGTKVQLFGDSKDYNNGVGQVGVRTLSWREVR